MIDFPRAWRIAKMTPFEDHHEECSFRVATGGFLCDCDVIWKHREHLDEKFMYGKDGEITRIYDENGIPSEVIK